ncbi:MAG: hypothetical protein VW665_06005, partial [Candidatus Puniceispirillum sp.]
MSKSPIQNFECGYFTYNSSWLQENRPVRHLAVIPLLFFWLTMQPAIAEEKMNIAVSDKTFQEAIKAYKTKDYVHAFRLFEVQANAAQHDAQYNLALLLKTGRGTPQHYPD